jgi:hypothetical protein
LNRHKNLEQLYPLHIQALNKAKLIEGPIPTLGQEWEKYNSKRDSQTPLNSRMEKQKARNRMRAIFFCVGFSNVWKTPIHRTLSDLAKKFDLPWLRVSMSYHRFTNLRELFQGDMSAKLTREVISLDLQCEPCNCRPGKNNQCNYNNVCRERIAIYKVVCNQTGKVYIGNTQQHFKKRMEGHFGDVQKLCLKGIQSDSYARHHAKLLLGQFEKPTPAIQRSLITCSILWKGNPISAAKTFATRNCVLCMRERIEILKHSRENPNSLINSCNEIYGACRHKPQFHRYKNQPPSTDESRKDERVKATKKKYHRDKGVGRCTIRV